MVLSYRVQVPDRRETVVGVWYAPSDGTDLLLMDSDEFYHAVTPRVAQLRGCGIKCAPWTSGFYYSPVRFYAQVMLKYSNSLRQSIDPVNPDSLLK